MLSVQKAGGLASFVQAAIYVSILVIYLVAIPAATGLSAEEFTDPHALRPVLTNPVFDIADFLFGPIWALAGIIAALGLRDRLHEAAPNRTLLMLIGFVAAGALFTAGGVVQHMGRHIVSRTPIDDPATYEAIFRAHSLVVPGLTASGRVMLGIGLVPLGWAGLATGKLPRVLCWIYLVGGLLSFFAYLIGGIGELVAILGIVWNIWQGIVLWREAG